MAYPPAALPTNATDGASPTDTTPTAVLTAAEVNAMNAAVNDVVSELGANPSGAAADVGARLAAIESAAAALPGTYATRCGNDGVAVGDSITSFGGSETMAQNWFNHLAIRSLGRIRWRGTLATGGYKIQDVIDVWIPALIAMSPRPGFAAIMIGANDCSENAGVGFSLAAKSALYEGMIQQVLAAGIRPVLCMITPNDGAAGSLPAISNNVAAMNSWIRTRANRGGFVCIDAHAPLCNPSDGSMLATFRGSGGTDRVHPSPAGHKAIAEFNLSKVLAAWPDAPDGVANFGETANLLDADGLFQVDTNADGLADGWAVGGTPTGFTRSLVTPTITDDLIGKWQQIARTTTDANAAWIYRQISAGWSVGDVLEYSVRVQTEGFSGSGTSWSSYIKPGNLSNSYGAVNSWTEDVADGLLTVRFTVPPGATSLYAYVMSSGVPASGATVMRVGQATLRNLTATGLAAA